LKIEKYTSSLQPEQGKRIGYIELNLADFIGKGLSTTTFAMDKSQSLFLTVKIMVIPIDEGLSIHGMAMKARGNEDPDFSDDEPELGGGELMDILTHVHSAYKDKGVSEESKGT